MEEEDDRDERDMEHERSHDDDDDRGGSIYELLCTAQREREVVWKKMVEMKNQCKKGIRHKR